MSYKSARTKVDVALEPLTLSWSAQPTYVGNRGSLIVGGMANGASIQSVTSSNNNIAKSAGYSGNNVYVNLVGGGNATITVNANNGQSGTIQASAILPYLVEANGASVFYANPDGSYIRTGNDGLSGNRPTFGYYRTNVVSDANKFIVGTDNSSTTTYVGLNIAPDIYDSYMEPTMSIDGNKFSYPLSMYNSDSRLTEIWCGIKALHLSNWDYPAVANTSLGTCTVSAVNVSTGINSLVLNLRSMDPFADWSGDVISMPDEDDYGLINKFRNYANHSYSKQTVTLPKIIADYLRQGIEIMRNGSVLPSGDLRKCFSFTQMLIYNNVWKVEYQLTEASLSEHIAGVFELKGYVENSRSGERIYKDGAKFALYVNGAIGAKMTGIGTNVVQISTAWVGDEADYGFSMVSNAKLVGTNYTNGQSFGYIENTTIQNIPVDGTSLNARVYELCREGATLNSADLIMEAEKPRFLFKNVSGVGVFVSDGMTSYYYLHPANTPTVDDSLGVHGYYRLWLLESLDGYLSGPKQGWILDN